MNLYERDYSNLTSAEFEEWQEIREKENVGKIGDLTIRNNQFASYSKAARHYDSLFPNNFLDPIELKNEEFLQFQLDAFVKLVNAEDASERSILNFINYQKAYFIIGSILKEYFHFGHHQAYLFREFPLGNTYLVDFLLVGKCSDGWNFVFIEIEAPSGQIALQDGQLGEVFRKGINQLRIWDFWLQANYNSIRQSFDKARSENFDFPDEFTIYDKSRMNFVVVAGKRENFNKRTYRERRINKNNGILILHYDNLIDSSKNIIGQPTY